MADQQSLFDAGERFEQHPNATPAPIGSGPDGETCRTCRHYTRVQHHDYTYRKCGKLEPLWTHGPGTDIKASWPACREWEQEG